MHASWHMTFTTAMRARCNGVLRAGFNRLFSNRQRARWADSSSSFQLSTSALSACSNSAILDFNRTAVVANVSAACFIFVSSALTFFFMVSMRSVRTRFCISAASTLLRKSCPSLALILYTSRAITSSRTTSTRLTALSMSSSFDTSARK
jgi:hypothetical protein